jgi:hypothetical protein
MLSARQARTAALVRDFPAKELGGASGACRKTGGCFKNHVQNQKLEVRFNAIRPIFPSGRFNTAEPCARGPWV